MKLNKNASYVLLHLLAGSDSAAEISQRMPAVNLRSIQRALVRLSEGGIIDRHGVNNPRYSLNYEQVLKQPIDPKLLENNNRPTSSFNEALIEWLLKDKNDLNFLFGNTPHRKEGRLSMTKRELEYLTVELSWKSSALEGNTYSLLDTELLLTRGIKAKNKTSFETQMVLNHKAAIEFINDNQELFTSDISFATVDTIHQYIVKNLDIDTGIRHRLVKISASNYGPPTIPTKLREYVDDVLAVINKQPEPLAKALTALSLMPYLQPFEDGNKRVGRLLANAILIHSAGCGFTLRQTDGKQLALAYLSFYEFNSLRALASILESEVTP